MKSTCQRTRTEQYRRNLSKNELLRDITDNLIKDPEDVRQSVGYGVLAPLLHRFVIWVLQQAQEKGIKRVYFLARDAYFMYLAARIYVRHYGLDIDCRYLYCSRYAIRVPTYHRNIEKALDYITLGGLDITPEKIYARAGITGNNLEELLEERIIDFDVDEQIPRSRLSDIRQDLKDSVLFLEKLRETSRKAEPALEKYLKSEDLLSEEPAAFVDSGWVGSLQRDLNEELRRLGRKDYIEGYYYGLYEVPVKSELTRYHTYHFSPEGGLKRKVLFNNCLFESIFTAPHGMTIGYQQESDNKSVPILADLSKSRIQEVQKMEQALLRWQNALLKEQLGCNFEDLCRILLNRGTEKGINRNQALFMHHPTQDEAEAYGRLEFTDDILEYGGNQIATVLTEQELKENTLLGRLAAEFLHHKHVKQSGWYEGSTVLCCGQDEDAKKQGKATSKFIRGYSRYKYFMYMRKQQVWKHSH